MWVGVGAVAAFLSIASLGFGAVQPPAWWVVGAFPRYTQSDFKANETIENARNENPHGNQWNGLVGLGGREFRGRLVPAQSGALDLVGVFGPSPSNACAYAGFRASSEKASPSIITVTVPGPVRCFLNNALVGEGVDTLKMTVSLKAGMNSVLVKSWNSKGNPQWMLNCTIQSDSQLSFEPVEPVAEKAKPATGKRNVALWSEGARAATSSYAWRGTDKDQFGRNYINDGQLQGPAWSSLAQQNMPQWVWVKFAEPRKIDRLVLYAGQNTRDFTAEYSPDGGATFKKLFEKKDEKPGAQSSYAVEFQPVVVDNVRVRITRVEKSVTSGFDTASVTELEVYGEKPRGGVSSKKETMRGRDEVKASKLKPARGFMPDIKEEASQLVVSTPWYRMNLDKARPRMSYLSLDAKGRGEFFCNILRNAGAFPVVEPMFADTRIAEDGLFQRNGNVIEYPAVEVAPGVYARVAFRFREKDYDLELTTLSKRRQPLRGGLFRFDLDFRQTPTSFYGRAEDPVSMVTMPCYMNAPDCGTFRITQSGDGAVMRQYPSSDEFNLAAHCMFDIAPETTDLSEKFGAIPEGTWRGTFTFAVDPQIPFKDLVKNEPRLKGLPKYSLNMAQWRVDQGVMANNTVSTDCALSLQFYAEMAVYAPAMKDGISPMALVVPTVDRYLDGLGGHLMWHGFKVEVTPPGKWYASLESGGFIINSAWYAVRTLDEKNLLGRWLPRLESLAGHLEAHDIDGDGIVESGDRGHWFDTYNLPEGVKEAHSTAVNYEAFWHLADLETLAGRTEQAAHWQARADLIKKNYLKVFFNPETGVIGGWRDKEGKLHDPMFPWVNSYAICADLVSDEQAQDILKRFLVRMKEIGFGEAQYKYGMLTNLIPLKPDEWNHHGAREWQGYMNGSITSPYSNYFIMALYRHGFRETAEKMLWAQVESFDKGTFNSGVRIPYLPVRNPVGSAFYTWDGSHANGEGYLPENWHAYAGIFAGHFGIRFDKTGYSLESWSFLKGKKLPCGMPVMGKTQAMMQ